MSKFSGLYLERVLWENFISFRAFAEGGRVHMSQMEEIKNFEKDMEEARRRVSFLYIFLHFHSGSSEWGDINRLMRNCENKN